MTAAVCAAVILSGCQAGPVAIEEFAPSDDAPIFASSVFGVPASPRVTNLKRVPKGGGREQVGKPYQVRGKWYYPKDEPGYVASGKASWYGANFHGRLTANGEVYDMYHLSAAHPTFPLPSYARVTNRTNGHSVVVRVNDRGPYSHGRVLDMSSRAADVLDFKRAGIADVKVEYIGRAPLEGDDSRQLMASFQAGPGGPPPVMVAAAEEAPRRGFLSGLFGRRGAAEPAAPQIASVARQAPAARSGEPASAPAEVATAAASSVAASSAAAFAMPVATPTSLVRDSQIPSILPEEGIPSPAEAPGGIAVPMPLPASREMALSYAPALAEPGAHGALRSLGSGATAERSVGERIEIGTVDDFGVLAEIALLAAAHGRLVESTVRLDDVEISVFAIETAGGADVDALLASLWDVGATGAFVPKD